MKQISIFRRVFHVISFQLVSRYIYSVSNQMCYIKMNVAQATTLASKASDVVGWNSSEGAIFHTTNQIFIHLYSSCLTSYSYCQNKEQLYCCSHLIQQTVKNIVFLNSGNLVKLLGQNRIVPNFK